MKKFIFFLLVSLGAQANECAQDAKKFCSGVEPGKGQLALCLSDYQDSLSPKCAAELKAYKQNTAKKNPCFEDLAQYCADLPSDPLNYEYCLIKHESKLSAQCSKDFIQKKVRILNRNVCAQDIADRCYKELSGPDGAVNKCLIKNKAKLSKLCQNNLSKKIEAMRKRNPCYDDTEKFCPTQVKFVDIQDCLSKKVSSLSPTCKKVVEKENVKLKANPCYRDLITHCRPGITPKQQNECMVINEEHLSHACKQFRAVEKKKVEKMVEVCEKDRLNFCKDAPFKDGAVVKCLRKNKEKISKECKQLL
ncbi:MAG: hypothetical protein ACLGHN_01110 [Bacteriovoracia bacterium]